MSSWTAFSTKIARLPESERMQTVSSAWVLGWTAVAAAPAPIAPGSARIHSTRVEEETATRSSGRTPRASSPAAIAWTRSAVCAQVSECYRSAPAAPPEAGTG